MKPTISGPHSGLLFFNGSLAITIFTVWTIILFGIPLGQSTSAALLGEPSQSPEGLKGCGITFTCPSQGPDCKDDRTDYDPRCPGYGTPGSGNDEGSHPKGKDSDNVIGGGTLDQCSGSNPNKPSRCDTTTDNYKCFTFNDVDACEQVFKEAKKGGTNGGWIIDNSCPVLPEYKGKSRPCVIEP